MNDCPLYTLIKKGIAKVQEQSPPSFLFFYHLRLFVPSRSIFCAEILYANDLSEHEKLQLPLNTI